MSYDDLYAALIAELENIRRNLPDRLKTIEANFLIAWRYRNRLPLKDGHSAPVPVSPIAYFKTHLPRFEAELKYCELCYYVEKFSPTGPLHERQDFLLRELGRKGRIVAESPDLYQYIQSNRTDLDQTFFAADPDLAATYATTIATFLALDRYHAYLEAEFSELIRQKQP